MSEILRPPPRVLRGGVARTRGWHAGGVDAERTWVDRDARVDRLDLDAGAWVDVVRRWIPDAEEVYEHLLAEVDWRGSQLFRYDHVVQENRVGSWWARGKGMPL